jgi:hypothetical protein
MPMFEGVKASSRELARDANSNGCFRAARRDAFLSARTLKLVACRSVARQQFVTTTARGAAGRRPWLLERRAR